ncbi:MAG: caspase family protein, partial [Bacteroidota bacterium]
MSRQNPKEEITNHLLNGKIAKALEALTTTLEGKDDYDTAILLTSQYNDLSRQTRIGVITSSDAAVRRNRIVSAILELVNELEIDDQTVVINRREPAPINNPITQDNRRKLALVIGCNEYEHAGKLINPINDAYGIKENLESLGFTVSMRKNPRLKELKMAVDDFGIELRNFDVGLFYFAGHGVQVEGLNYLIPVEANLLEERFVEYDCLRADRVLRHMEKCNANVNIMILDACRNNPFERSWGRGLVGKGLATMNAPKGSLIGYATSPGQTAHDGNGQNGLYTGELIRLIGEKGLTITQLFQKVRSSVMNISNNTQI